eukprot:TRINITY_DN49239_c0_g1_i1.p1 TRINITY_DN49239_c0_g1~~TRINITY_DN49239_c0_g1_i1.p1  ORF type:complete len:1686 (-),score=371.71 TRINITY_DN49239_c0_g1_i1:130-5187(-)
MPTHVQRVLVVCCLLNTVVWAGDAQTGLQENQENAAGIPAAAAAPEEEVASSWTLTRRSGSAEVASAEVAEGQGGGQKHVLPVASTEAEADEASSGGEASAGAASRASSEDAVARKVAGAGGVEATQEAATAGSATEAEEEERRAVPATTQSGAVPTKLRAEQEAPAVTSPVNAASTWSSDSVRVDEEDAGKAATSPEEAEVGGALRQGSGKSDSTNTTAAAHGPAADDDDVGSREKSENVEDGLPAPGDGAAAVAESSAPATAAAATATEMESPGASAEESATNASSSAPAAAASEAAEANSESSRPNAATNTATGIRASGLSQSATADPSAGTGSLAPTLGQAAVVPSAGRSQCQIPKPSFLSLLCHLYDPAVDHPASAATVAPASTWCADVGMPLEYLEVCGRRQCSDAGIDFCLLSNRTQTRIAFADKHVEDTSSPAGPAEEPTAPTDSLQKMFPPGLAALRSRWPLMRKQRHRAQAGNVCHARSPLSHPRLGGGPFGRQQGQQPPAQCPVQLDAPFSCDGPEKSTLGEWAYEKLQDFFGVKNQCGSAGNETTAASTQAPPLAPPIELRARPPRRRPDQCGRADALFQCDAHLASVLTELWKRIGVPLAGKLRPAGAEIPPSAESVASTSSNSTAGNGSGSNLTSSPPSAPEAVRWRHCADEGEFCLCVGDVRFGVAGTATGVGARWTPEVLSVRHGLIVCSTTVFGSKAADGLPQGPRVCQCLSAASPGHLVVPGKAAVPPPRPAGPAQEHTVQPRFIKGAAYQDKFLNGLSFDYASNRAGGRLVTHSKGIRSARAILGSDMTEYMLAPCSSRPYFVVSLLEDLFLEHIGLVSLEYFASGFRHLQILGSSTFPTTQWRLLGEIETSPTASHELFDIGSRCRHQTDMCWVRFLKVRTLSHHHMVDNSFCAITRLQAFGSTQITYIAEERKKEDEVDRRVEPLVSDVVQWHEIASKWAAAPGSSFNGLGLAASDAALLSQATRVETQAGAASAEMERRTMRQEPNSLPTAGASTSEPTGPAGAPRADEAAEAASTASASTSATGMVHQPDQHPNAQLVSRSPSIIASWSPGRLLPSWPTGGGAASSTAAAEDVSPTSYFSAQGLDDMLRSVLPATAGGRSEQHPLEGEDGVLAFDRLHDTLNQFLSALGGNLSGDSAAASASLSGASATTPQDSGRQVKSATSSATPQLVRMHNDLRYVQEDQAALQDNMRNLGAGLSAAVLVAVKAVKELMVRIEAQEETSMTSAWWQMHPLGYGCGAKEPEEVGPHGAVGLRLGLMRVLASMTFDRVVILCLVVWNFLSWRRSPSKRRSSSLGSIELPEVADDALVPLDVSPAQPVAQEQTEEQHRPARKQQQKDFAELNRLTISGGGDVMRELRAALRQQKHQAQGSHRHKYARQPQRAIQWPVGAEASGAHSSKRAQGRRASHQKVAPPPALLLDDSDHCSMLAARVVEKRDRLQGAGMREQAGGSRSSGCGENSGGRSGFGTDHFVSANEHGHPIIHGRTADRSRRLTESSSSMNERRSLGSLFDPPEPEHSDDSFGAETSSDDTSEADWQRLARDERVAAEPAYRPRVRVQIASDRPEEVMPRTDSHHGSDAAGYVTATATPPLQPTPSSAHPRTMLGRHNRMSSKARRHKVGSPPQAGGRRRRPYEASGGDGRGLVESAHVARGGGDATSHSGSH